MASISFSPQPCTLVTPSGDPIGAAAPISVSVVQPTVAPILSVHLSSTLVSASGGGDMAVDGSSSPVVFSSSPVASAWRVSSIRIVLVDHGEFKWDDFASTDALSLGLSVAWVIGGVTYEVANSKDNLDMASVFDMRKEVTDDEEDLALSFLLNISPPIHLPIGDSVSITVRDDLSGLDQMRATVMYTKDVP